MVYTKIIEKIACGQKQLAVLIDPEKVSDAHLQVLIGEINKTDVDFILLGGSTFSHSADAVLASIRQLTTKHVVLFPGNASQVTAGVDAVLFLSLLSGRNPEYLVGNHVKAAPLLKGVEVIPTAYLLIDGGRQSATERVTQTTPMSALDIESIVNTALAGQLMGNQFVYLEAGSGAKFAVLSDIITQVKAAIDIPLVVGGGLRTKADLQRVYQAGADIAVMGNALEQDPSLLSTL